MTLLVQGHLDYNNSVPLCDCVVKEVDELLPNEDNAARDGYIYTHNEDLDSDTTINLLD